MPYTDHYAASLHEPVPLAVIRSVHGTVRGEIDVAAPRLVIIVAADVAFIIVVNAIVIIVVITIIIVIVIITITIVVVATWCFLHILSHVHVQSSHKNVFSLTLISRVSLHLLNDTVH